eukprot:COSAG01_NODE_10586_length_2128_cov_1.787087_5_plen_48_part_01
MREDTQTLGSVSLHYTPRGSSLVTFHSFRDSDPQKRGWVTAAELRAIL